MMNVKIARETIAKFLCGQPEGTAKATECEAAVVAVAADETEKKAAKFAFNNGAFDLKARGLMETVSRGVWKVTDVGRQFAVDGVLPPAPKKDKPTVPVGDGTTTTVPAGDGTTTTGAAPEGTAPAGDGTTAPEGAPAGDGTPAPGPLALEAGPPEWLGDDTIRNTVIENSPCFGAFSSRSPECGGCPLVGYCRNAKAATLTLLAQKLTVAPAALTSPPALPKTTERLDATVSKVNAPAAARTAASAEAPVMKASFDGTDAVSGKPIHKGDEVKYIKGTGIVLVNP